MKIKAQLYSVNKNADKVSSIVFTSTADELKKITKFIDDFTVEIEINGTESKDKIIGQIINANTSVNSSKFKLICPATENIKTAELSTLCGEELELDIEISSFC